MQVSEEVEQMVDNFHCDWGIYVQTVFLILENAVAFSTEDEQISIQLRFMKSLEEGETQ